MNCTEIPDAGERGTTEGSLHVAIRKLLVYMNPRTSSRQYMRQTQTVFKRAEPRQLMTGTDTTCISLAVLTRQRVGCSCLLPGSWGPWGSAALGFLSLAAVVQDQVSNGCFSSKPGSSPPRPLVPLLVVPRHPWTGAA